MYTAHVCTHACFYRAYLFVCILCMSVHNYLGLRMLVYMYACFNAWASELGRSTCPLGHGYVLLHLSFLTMKGYVT